MMETYACNQVDIDVQSHSENRNVEQESIFLTFHFVCVREKKGGGRRGGEVVCVLLVHVHATYLFLQEERVHMCIPRGMRMCRGNERIDSDHSGTNGFCSSVLVAHI